MWDVGRAGVLGLLVEGAGPAAQRVAAHRVVNLQSVYRILLEIATYSSARCRSRRNQPADRNRIVLLEIATYRLAQRVAAHLVVNLQSVYRTVLLEIAT